MLKKILLVLAAIVVAILVIAAFQPSTFRVERSIAINTPAAVPFAQVNELAKWQPWSPWEKLDPAMKRSYSGPAAGVGAAYGWEGNSEVGSGKMTIIDSRPSEAIKLKLEFLAPMAGAADADFTFKPEGSATRVTWAMSGTNNYIAKIFCLFMNMDKMIGGQFEQGLGDLKKVSESAAKK